MCSSRQRITIGKGKTRARFRYIPVYFGIFIQNQAYFGIFRTLRNPSIFRGLTYLNPETYLEPWYIQNPGVFRTLAYSEPGAYENPEKHLQ